MRSGAVEIRSTELASGDGLLTGYAALFWTEAVIGGEFRERIASAAFTKSLLARDVLALWNHDGSRILGRKSSGTLRLFEDAKGLRFELDADLSTPDGQTAIGTVRRQDVAGCSFGFSVADEDWDDAGDLPLRTIREIRLYEISLTPSPAYPQTTVVLGQRSSGGLSAAARAMRMKAEAAMRARGIPL